MYNASLNCQHFHSLSINSSFPVCCSTGIAAEGLALAVPRERSLLGCTGADFQPARLHQRPTAALHTRTLRRCPYPGGSHRRGRLRQATAAESSWAHIAAWIYQAKSPSAPACCSAAEATAGQGAGGPGWTCLKPARSQVWFRQMLFVPSAHRRPARIQEKEVSLTSYGSTTCLPNTF